MTVELWKACLQRFEIYGTRNEQMMASILLRIIAANPEGVASIFDAYASEILEAAP